MKSDAVFKKAFNDTLEILSRRGDNIELPTESELARQLGVSRTTARKVFALLEQQGAIASSGRVRNLKKSSSRLVPFPQNETVPQSAQVERLFMEWILRDDARPGTTINELELARQFGIATTSVREFLNRFLHFGLIEKRPNAGWVFRGFTIEFALELFEIREMFEVRSAKAFLALPAHSPLWWQLETIRDQHLVLLEDIDRRFHDFSDLDNRFHRLVNSAAPNRFIDDFYDIISMIFHYHYQWNKKSERQRNEVAAREHLVYIEALLARKPEELEKACRAHLATAKQTLISSTLV